MAGVFASAKIYQVPARPAWNTVRTPLRFFLTGLILGPLFSLLLYSIYGLTHFSGKISSFFLGPVFTWILVSGFSAFLQLLVLLGRLFSLRPDQPDELYGSALLLIRRFKFHFLTRMSLLALASFVVPFWILNLLSQENVSFGLFFGLATASFTLSLLGELLGRYLFFVTVVPKNIPGSFFTGNGERH
jgi:DMSO reductase anchor subunit